MSRPPASDSDLPLDPETTRKLALAAMRTDSAVVIGDGEGFVEWVNEAFTRLTGISAGEILGKRIQEVVPHRDLDPASRARLREQFARGEAAKLELRIPRREGGSLWLALEVRPVTDATGRPAHFLALATDLTDLRRAEKERRQLEDRLRDAQRLESLQALAGGVAHDFNNLLGVILGQTDLALMDLDPESPVLARLRQIRRTTLRAAELTDQMLAYAGRRRVVSGPVDLSRLVVGLSTLLDSLASRRATLSYDLAGDLPPIQGDAAPLRQLLVNVVSNALEAQDDADGAVRVRTGVRELGADALAEAQPRGSLAPGSYVYLEVRDSGCGLDPATRARAFEPFFTTKGPGRGLGLAAALGIVRAHGGAICLAGEPERGTRVTVLFPRGRAERKHSAPALEAPATRPGRVSGARVLVVEDEVDLREMAVHTLERFGFEVLTAGNGQEGVARFREHADEIDVVLLDLTMPGMRGDEALRQMRAIRPGARVVLTSGYTDDEVAERLADEPLDRFLPKPYSPEQLVVTLRELLER